MADPPVPTENDVDILNKITDAQSKYSAAVAGFGDIAAHSNSILDKFQNALGMTGFKLEDLGKVAANQSTVFTGLGIAVLKAQDAFAGFNNSVSTAGIMTFSGQFKDLREMFRSGSLAGDQAKTVLESLKQQFLKMGGAPELLAKAVAKGTEAVFDLTENMFAMADRAIASQDALLQTAAATGQLGAITAKAGEDLQSMNTLMDMYNEVTNQAKGETNSTSAQIASYSSILQTIPNAMNTVIKSASAEGKEMSGLSAMIKLAHGTHRDFGKVVEDVKHSVVGYGSSLEDSMRFTANMTDLTSKLGAQFDDVKGGIFGITDALSKFTDAGAAAGKMQDAVSQMMGEYVSRLQATGMPAKQAIELVTNLGQQFGQLNIAQKAFLSGQTGGPGGLMGGYQIEKMIREGDTAGLQKKLMDVFQKQFGNRIVTLEDATKSQAAAAQLTRQTALMRQGPMGQFFKTDDDAHRFMEVMKAEKEGTPLPGGAQGFKLDAHVLDKTVKAGSTWEAKTNTVVNSIGSDVARIRDLIANNALTGVQKAMTAASLPRGEERADSSAESKMAEEVRSRMAKFGLRGGEAASILQGELTGKKRSSEFTGDLRKTHTEQAVGDFVVDMKQLPDLLKSAYDSMVKSASKGNIKEAGREEAALRQDILDRRAAADKKGVSQADKIKLLESAQAEEDKLQEYQEWKKKFMAGKKPEAMAAQPPIPGGTAPRANLGPLPRNAPGAGAQVADAQRGTPARRTGTPATPGGDVPADVHVQQTGAGNRFDVHVNVNVRDKGGQGPGTAPQGGT